MSDTKKPEGQPEEPAKPVVPDSLEELLGQFSQAPAIDEEVAKAQAANSGKQPVKKSKKEVPAKGKPAEASPAPAGKQPHPAHVAAVSNHIRQTVVGVLKTLSPAAYDEYVARKFKGVTQGDRPSLEQSQAAYVWAFEQFLKLTYKKSGV